MLDVVVVGAGIFGRVIAAHLARGGLSVEIVDDARPDSGSRPAGCVIKPSWVSALTAQELSEHLTLLDELFGVQDVEFTVRPSGKKVGAYRVEPSRILTGPVKERRIVSTATAEQNAMVVDEAGRHLIARYVIVAAGLWTPVLCPWVETWGRWGWSFRGPRVSEPVISMWAPYRQVVVFNMDDGRSWSGDGSALVLKTAEKPGAFKSAMDRCTRIVGEGVMHATRGVRPYAKIDKGELCAISNRGRVIAVTGGAKNGTIAAAWAAREIERRMRL